MFANAIISGWIIATMVWMFPSAGSAKIVVIILMTWLIALADTTHIVVGSVEVLYLVFSGTLHWSHFSGHLRFRRWQAISAAGRLFLPC
jgi:formate/nitrite transporter FocA (FNT family)